MKISCPFCNTSFEKQSVGAIQNEIVCANCKKTFIPPNVETVPIRQVDDISLSPIEGMQVKPEIYMFGDEEFKPGTIIGKCKIIELIGKGGMGIVYKAVQTPLNRIVALKVLSEKFAKDANFIKRFEREARALAELSHPNIISI